MRAPSREDGLTLLELVIVTVIIGILLAVITAFYAGERTDASDQAARTNIRAALPAIEAYRLDNGDSYSGMTLADLQTQYSPGVQNIAVVSAAVDSYCVRSTVGNRSWYKTGPSAAITATACS